MLIRTIWLFYNMNPFISSTTNPHTDNHHHPDNHRPLQVSSFPFHLASWWLHTGHFPETLSVSGWMVWNDLEINAYTKMPAYPGLASVISATKTRMVIKHTNFIISNLVCRIFSLNSSSKEEWISAYDGEFI